VGSNPSPGALIEGISEGYKADESEKQTTSKLMSRKTTSTIDLQRKQQERRLYHLQSRPVLSTIDVSAAGFQDTSKSDSFKVTGTNAKENKTPMTSSRTTTTTPCDEPDDDGDTIDPSKCDDESGNHPLPPDPTATTEKDTILSLQATIFPLPPTTKMIKNSSHKDSNRNNKHRHNNKNRKEKMNLLLLLRQPSHIVRY
jgi:hypothetical protein